MGIGIVLTYKQLLRDALEHPVVASGHFARFGCKLYVESCIFEGLVGDRNLCEADHTLISFAVRDAGSVAGGRGGAGNPPLDGAWRAEFTHPTSRWRWRWEGG